MEAAWPPAGACLLEKVLGEAELEVGAIGPAWGQKLRFENMITRTQVKMRCTWIREA